MIEKLMFSMKMSMGHTASHFQIAPLHFTWKRMGRFWSLSCQGVMLQHQQLVAFVASCLWLSIASLNLCNRPPGTFWMLRLHSILRGLGRSRLGCLWMSPIFCLQRWQMTVRIPYLPRISSTGSHFGSGSRVVNALGHLTGNLKP